MSLPTRVRAELSRVTMPKPSTPAATATAASSRQFLGFSRRTAVAQEEVVEPLRAIPVNGSEAIGRHPIRHLRARSFLDHTTLMSAACHAVPASVGGSGCTAAPQSQRTSAKLQGPATSNGPIGGVGICSLYSFSRAASPLGTGCRRPIDVRACLVR